MFVTCTRPEMRQNARLYIFQMWVLAQTWESSIKGTYEYAWPHVEHALIHICEKRKKKRRKRRENRAGRMEEEKIKTCNRTPELDFKPYYFPRGCALIGHFLPSFWNVVGCMLATNTALVFQVVGFAITLITLSVFLRLPLGNWAIIPSPQQQFNRDRTFQQYSRISGIIASHIMQQGDK